jgi:hypothetical protein
MTDVKFYRRQAEDQQSKADGASLANVRHRSQSAADAWTALADREQKNVAARARRAAAATESPGAPEPSENPDRGTATPGPTP